MLATHSVSAHRQRSSLSQTLTIHTSVSPHSECVVQTPDVPIGHDWTGHGVFDSSDGIHVYGLTALVFGAAVDSDEGGPGGLGLATHVHCLSVKHQSLELLNNRSARSLMSLWIFMI